MLSLLCVLCCGDSGTSGVKPGAGHDTAGPRNAALLTEVGYKEHLFCQFMGSVCGIGNPTESKEKCGSHGVVEGGGGCSLRL